MHGETIKQYLFFGFGVPKLRTSISRVKMTELRGVTACYVSKHTLQTLRRHPIF